MSRAFAPRGGNELLRLVSGSAVGRHGHRPAAAQTTSGSMSGSVVDESTRPFPARPSPSSTRRPARSAPASTQRGGRRSRSPALVAGPYTIRVSMDGFRPLEVRGRVVLANNRLAVGALQLDVGALTEEVSVTARGETVATTTTSHQAAHGPEAGDEPLDQRPRPDLAAEDPARRAACCRTIRRRSAAASQRPCRRSRAAAVRRSTSTASTAAMAAAAATSAAPRTSTRFRK